MESLYQGRCETAGLSDGTPRPKMGDIQILPINANARKWLSLLDAAYALRIIHLQN
jgi:hypothetical protein